MGGRIRETPDEFVDVPDALNGSKTTTIPKEEQRVSGVETMERCGAYPAK